MKTQQLAFMRYENYRYIYPRRDRLDRLCLALGHPRLYDYYKKGLALHPQQMVKVGEFWNLHKWNISEIYDATSGVKARREIDDLAGRMIKRLENGERTSMARTEHEIYSLAEMAAGGRSECRFHQGGLEYQEHRISDFAFGLFGAMHTMADAGKHSAKSRIDDGSKGWLTFTLCCKEKVEPDSLSNILLSALAGTIGARLEVSRNELGGGTDFVLCVPSENRGKRPKPRPPTSLGASFPSRS